MQAVKQPATLESLDHREAQKMLLLSALLILLCAWAKNLWHQW